MAVTPWWEVPAETSPFVSMFALAGLGVAAGAVGVDQIGSLRDRISAGQANDRMPGGQRGRRDRMPQPGRPSKNQNLHGFELTEDRQGKSGSVL